MLFSIFISAALSLIVNFYVCEPSSRVLFFTAFQVFILQKPIFLRVITWMDVFMRIKVVRLKIDNLSILLDRVLCIKNMGPRDPCGNNGRHLLVTNPLGNANGNRLVTMYFRASHPRWHLWSEEIQNSPPPGLGNNQKSPPWASFFCLIPSLCPASSPSRLTLIGDKLLLNFGAKCQG